ncbi:hypothetical protein ACGF3G_13740 [Streptomyces sp. NPDC048179]|uniref:hypothetical protein n=1 Tax=unclassified Streptomyces TaxID=2593676 RepID=UPI003442B9B2
MGPNDAQIVRIFSREEKGKIADVTLAPGSDALVVLEAEAGFILFDGHGDYLVTLVVRDLSDGTLIPATVPGVATPNKVAGRFADATWSDLAASFKFVVTGTELAKRKGHLVQAYGSVVYGHQHPGATLAESPLFMIQP